MRKRKGAPGSPTAGLSAHKESPTASRTAVYRRYKTHPPRQRCHHHDAHPDDDTCTKNRRNSSTMCRRIHGLVYSVIQPLALQIHRLPSSTCFFFDEQQCLESMFSSIVTDCPTITKSKHVFMGEMSSLFDRKLCHL